MSFSKAVFRRCAQPELEPPQTTLKRRVLLREKTALGGSIMLQFDTDVRAYVVETLRELGYDVLEAAGGEEALALMDRHKTISLLLTDVVMPGQNGRKLADTARQRQASLKVLYMTGYSRNAIVHQGRLDPGVELLQKPLTSEQLATTVRKVLDA